MNPAAPLLALTALGQHCVPYGEYGDDKQNAWYSSDRAFRIQRVEWDNWRTKYRWGRRDSGDRYEAGEPFPIEGVVEEFYFSTILVSPTGSGFLVTGEPREKDDWGKWSEKIPPEENWLYSFHAPDGARLWSVPITRALTEKELATKGSCGKPTERGCYRFYAFAERPHLSRDGMFCDFKAANTERFVRIFLPMGRMPEESFDADLAEWISLDPPDRAAAAKTLSDLDDESADVRDAATAELRRRGWRALAPMQEALEGASPEARSRLRALLDELAVWRLHDDKTPPRNLVLLSGLLVYPNPKVQAAARARILAILPDSTPNFLKDKTVEEASEWIREKAARFRWQSERRAYIE